MRAFGHIPTLGKKVAEAYHSAVGHGVPFFHAQHLMLEILALEKTKSFHTIGSPLFSDPHNLDNSLSHGHRAQQRGHTKISWVHKSEFTVQFLDTDVSSIVSSIRRRLHAGRSALSVNSSHLGSPSEGSTSDASQQSQLASCGPLSAGLTERSVIRLEGEDTFRFLQGLVSNDVNLLRLEARTTEASVPTPNQPVFVRRPIFTAILTPQGRFLYDAFLYTPPRPVERLDRSGRGPGDNNSSDDVVLAEVDASAKDDIIALLKRYRLRAKVGIEDVSEDFAVWVRFGGGSASDPDAGTDAEAGGVGWGGTQEPAAAAAAKATGDGWQWFKDPRLPMLGLRGLFPKGTVPPLVEADEEVTAAHYKLWRYEHGVPEGTDEISSGEALPLEYNLDALCGVSYDKGCYVGQELTARTHHRGVIRKRLMPVRFLSANDSATDVEKGPTQGSEVVDKESGKAVGKINAAIGSRGLAHLRLEAVTSPGKILHATLGDSKQVVVQPIRPAWWPPQWGYEEKK